MRQFSRFQLILIVAIVALLGVNVYLAIGYFGAVDRKASLQSDIDKKEQAIAGMPTEADISGLERQLDVAEQKLAEEAPFPQTIDDVDLFDHIADAVQKARLETYTYKPGKKGKETIGESTYTTISYAITTGERLSRLLNFLNLIEMMSEETPYNTITIRDIALTSAGETWSLKFNLVIITQ